MEAIPSCPQHPDDSPAGAKRTRSLPPMVGAPAKRARGAAASPAPTPGHNGDLNLGALPSGAADTPPSGVDAGKGLKANRMLRVAGVEAPIGVADDAAAPAHARQSYRRSPAKRALTAAVGVKENIDEATVACAGPEQPQHGGQAGCSPSRDAHDGLASLAAGLPAGSVLRRVLVGTRSPAPRTTQ